jgi:hypothetical protein
MVVFGREGVERVEMRVGMKETMAAAEVLARMMRLDGWEPWNLSVGKIGGNSRRLLG